MDNFERLKKSLNVVAIANFKGEVDDETLINAFENFSKAINFSPDDNYEIIKSKTFYDSLNGIIPDQELMKALQLGQTKVKNGITYIVKMTPSGKLDWRKVINKDKKDSSSKSASTEDFFDTENFPSLSDIEIVKSLGGSTGAQLVKDKNNGKEYVMKKGASAAHVEEEYLANSIYSCLGISVPNMKLYKSKSGSLILSEYMPNTEVANSNLTDDIRKDILNNFVADCLLANWDAYKNDNILINKDDGKIYRVDNGGSLRFSAQGRDKGDHFEDEVNELESMVSNNIQMTSGLTQKDINKQIKKILKKKDTILSMIEDDDLNLKMHNRFASLELRLEDLDESKDPYRELSEKEMEKALSDAGGMWNSDNTHGWNFLSNICKLRGFDKVATEVDDQTFEKAISEDGAFMVNRGVQGFNGRTAQELLKDFTENEDCFYGRVGMYGAGIYGAVNKPKKNPPPPNHDYQIAYEYAGYKDTGVMDICIPSDAKVIYTDELDSMMSEEFFGSEFKELKNKYDDAKQTVYDLEKKQDEIEKKIEQTTKEKMGWDEDTFDELNNVQGLPGNYSYEKLADLKKNKFSKAVEYYTKVVKKLAGDVKKINDQTYEITLPHTNEKFILNEGIAQRSDMKLKNSQHIAYNLHYKYLNQHLVQNHFAKINDTIKERITSEKKSSKEMLDIKNEIKENKDILDKITHELNKVKTNGSSSVSKIMADIASRTGGEARGFYAAIKGYDAIIQKNGWGGNTDFAVIINRSKCLVRKK